MDDYCKYSRKVFDFPNCILFFINEIGQAIRDAKKDNKVSITIVVDTEKYSYHLDVVKVISKTFEKKGQPVGMPKFKLITQDNGDKLFHYEWDVLIRNDSSLEDFENDLPF